MKVVTGTSIILLGLCNMGFTQDCDRPDVLYIAFGFQKPSYLYAFRTNNSDSGRRFIFDYGQESDVFFQKSEEKEMTNDELERVKIYSISEARIVEQSFLKCYMESIKNGETLTNFFHDQIFQTIFIIEKRDDKYFKLRVSWLDISVD